MQRVQAARALGHRPDHLTIDQWLSTEESENGLATVAGFRQQQVDSAIRCFKRHIFRSAAEFALLRVAVGATEIALRGNRERQGVDGRGCERDIVDQGRAGEPDLLQESSNVVSAASSSCCAPFVRA